MKKLISLLVYLCVAMLLASAARAGTTNLLNLAYVNGTNNGNAFNISGIYVPSQKVLVQSLGITNNFTNVISANLQISVDANNTNWITLATFNPSTTNATVESWTPTLNSITLPARVQVVTSNSTGVSVFLTQ